MLKFKDYKYERPNMEKLENEFNELIDQFNKSESTELQDNTMKKINKLRNDFETMKNLVLIRHTINTNDEFYDKEKEFMDNSTPTYQGLVNKFYKALVESKYRDKLEKKWGDQIFKIADLELKTFSEEIIEDLKKENKLSSQYTKLRASAKIVFENEEYNISQMVPFLQSKNRTTRKKAHEAMTKFFEDNEEEFDTIFDEMVQVRDKIAKKLGYENFVQLGYDRLTRTDYDSKMVANYRKQVLENIVPLAEKLQERQLHRLGLDDLKYYDEPLKFLTGNATPKGDYDWMLENGRRMYEELSTETNEFFNFMIDKELLDLMAKKGKAGGGYCTFIANYKSPFIFSNFNGTSDDVDVLTHEAGHAFQVYSSRNFELPEYVWPTLEACEIHSMSMEFFAWPWMELFFEEDVEKYKFSHLSEALLFIPYGVTVDEFQHWVYENPTATPCERKAKWRDIERKYLPNKDYADNDFLQRGGYWFRQGHIFNNPFYYIDYTLAQVCAFQYWIESRENNKKAWDSYLTLCKMGGSKSFLELVNLAELNNPFENGSIKKVTYPIEKWLDGIDDKSL